MSEHARTPSLRAAVELVSVLLDECERLGIALDKAREDEASNADRVEELEAALADAQRASEPLLARVRELEKDSREKIHEVWKMPETRKRIRALASELRRIGAPDLTSAEIASELDAIDANEPSPKGLGRDAEIPRKKEAT